MGARRTRILALAAGVVVLAGAVGVLVVRDRRQRVPVQTQKLARQDLVSVVTASGEVRPKRFVNVSANVSGRITRLLVQEGDRVRSGQVLAHIDSTRVEAETRQSAAGLEAARSELDRARADLELARLGFERTQRVHADQLVSDQAMDQAQAELKQRAALVEAQKRRVAQLEAALESNQDTLEKHTLPAPMDGVVTSLQKEEGEVVIGAQSFQPTVIMTVADLSVMEAEVLVDETDIRNVRLGQPAEVRVDAFEGVKIKGQVTEIGSSAIPRGGVTSASSGGSSATQAKDFKVTITLQEPPENLRPGLNASADIETARKANVVAAPIQAVVVRAVDREGKVVDPAATPSPEAGTASANPARRRGPGEEREGVFVVAKGQAQFKPVKTGILGETEIEILEGVAEGEEIVSGSYKTLRTLKDQARITVEKKRERS